MRYLASPPFYWDPSFGLVAINCVGRIECQDVSVDQESATRVVQMTLIRHHTHGPLWRRDISQAMRLCGGRPQRVFLHLPRCTMWLMVASEERVVSVMGNIVQSVTQSVAENTAEVSVVHAWQGFAHKGRDKSSIFSMIYCI